MTTKRGFRPRATVLTTATAAMTLKKLIAFALSAIVATLFAVTPAHADKWAEPYRAPSVTGGAKKISKSTTAKPSKGVKVASLGNTYYTPSTPKKSLSGGGGGVKWVANSGCLNSSLKSLVNQVAANYGPVTVSSTCRSASHNKSVGGAPKSYHLSGNAVDFRVHGNVSGAAAYLKSRVGGYKNDGGLFHIDTGPRRPMG